MCARQTPCSSCVLHTQTRSDTRKRVDVSKRSCVINRLVHAAHIHPVLASMVMIRSVVRHQYHLLAREAERRRVAAGCSATVVAAVHVRIVVSVALLCLIDQLARRSRLIRRVAVNGSIESQPGLLRASMRDDQTLANSVGSDHIVPLSGVSGWYQVTCAHG
jgi:hypothetical protein